MHKPGAPPPTPDPSPELLACTQSIAMVLAQKQSWDLAAQDAARLALGTLRDERDLLSLTLADELARGLQIAADRDRRELRVIRRFALQHSLRVVGGR